MLGSYVVRGDFTLPSDMGPGRHDVAYFPNPDSIPETHFAIAHQAAPHLYRPTWHVGHLVFQGGVPNLKRSSMTGGGFVPQRDGYAGKEGPSWQPYATPVVSAVGGGSLPSRSNFLTSLFGGRVGPNQ